VLVGGLAFLAGVADVMAFDHYGCFANMMTGNTFRAMGALASSQWNEAGFHAALVLTYVMGVATYRRVDLRQPGAARRAVAPAVLLLFAARDLAAIALPGTRWHMLLLVLGFALLNAISSEELGAVTCMVTGHLHKLGNALAERRGARRSVGVLLAFCAGAAFGTAGTEAAAAAAAAASTRWLARWLTRVRFTLLALSYALMFALHQLALHRRLATPTPTPTPGTADFLSRLDEYEAQCR